MIPRAVLLACEPFDERLSAARVGGAIACGLQSRTPALEMDLCEIEDGATDPESVRRLLERLDFDTRMRRARAVVIATGRLDHRTLLRDRTMFEIATRARQGGVPAYAIVGHNDLDPFEARILDLQVVLQAGDKQGRTKARRLTLAGESLAELV